MKRIVRSNYLNKEVEITDFNNALNTLVNG